ncbi:MAG TPA: SDR family NAD(P)-dependent oxidoreductase [Pseudonocardiaceae bacterium]|jgi:NAD(P)-dependent dehydrogenase (short-subunit alcohol dehydrogenase family)|nr:SDR family NAD(P)-dependent oxidoreductase [Pseudonocardiaceae bacterium]
MSWDPRCLPAAPGKVFVITGGNAGIGYYTAEQLASTGAKVILAGRNQTKIDAALTAIRRQVPGADLGSIAVDLAELSSVRSAAERINALDRVDAVIANAAVYGDKQRSSTADGFELHFGTNHLANFALAARSYPALARTPGSRLVFVSSLSYQMTSLDLDDAQSERDYKTFRAYGRSKIALMLFALELDRRLRAAGSPVSSIAAHPGGGLDVLSPRRPGVTGPLAGGLFMQLMMVPLAQSKAKAAWSQVRATLDPELTGGRFLGPRLGLRGRPKLLAPKPQVLDQAAAQRLWTMSEELTGVEFTLAKPVS